MAGKRTLQEVVEGLPSAQVRSITWPEKTSSRAPAGTRLSTRASDAWSARRFLQLRSSTRSCSRSATMPGPIGRHPSRFWVKMLDAGMSKVAKAASQPK